MNSIRHRRYVGHARGELQLARSRHLLGFAAIVVGRIRDVAGLLEQYIYIYILNQVPLRIVQFLPVPFNFFIRGAQYPNIGKHTTCQAFVVM